MAAILSPHAVTVRCRAMTGRKQIGKVIFPRNPPLSRSRAIADVGQAPGAVQPSDQVASSSIDNGNGSIASTGLQASQWLRATALDAR